MKTIPLHRLWPLAGAVLALLLLPGAVGLELSGQTSVNADVREKIRLLAEALKARDEGNLAVAKGNLETLIRMSPEDASLQRLLAAVNADMERQMQGQPRVYGQASGMTAETVLGTPATGNVAIASTGSIDSPDINRLLLAAQAQQGVARKEAERLFGVAKNQAEQGSYTQADATLVTALAGLPAIPANADLRENLTYYKNQLLLKQAREAIADGRLAEAERLIGDYERVAGADDDSRRMTDRLDKAKGTPQMQEMAAINPAFMAEQGQIEGLLVTARAQLINGDFAGAAETLRQAALVDPTHGQVKALQAEVAKQQAGETGQNYRASRAGMLNEVAQSWARPVIIEETGREEIRVEDSSPILDKLKRIVIPRVTFAGELSRVIETLGELSVQYDDPALAPADRGVNLVLIDPSGKDPRVNISLRNLSLARILEFVTKQVNYQYEVAEDAVIVSLGDASGGNASLVTEFFPVSRATVIRLTGFREIGPAQAAAVDPFAPQAPAESAGPSVNEEEEALKGFFERAGVPFQSVPGATLAFDGTQLIVTQTNRNLERLRNILRRYDQTKQVEIEAKFMEVQQGDLDELGFQWAFNADGNPLINPTTGAPVLDATGQPVMQYDNVFQTGNRSLNSAFSVDPNDAAINISGPIIGNNSFPAAPPTPPSAVDLGADVVKDLFMGTAIIGNDELQVIVRALSRKSGSDLLSSPRLTVLSGKTASIVVAQELLYPESYGDIQLPAPGGSREGSVSTIAIAAGTPQDFVMRNVGVEMEVTPTVEDNDNISLLLEPKVTEFEGFVEYGGPSVAVGGDGTVVTVPSGFYQPIFATRSVRTEVTVYDGATVIIGGLVREEVKTVTDKVPVIGDIPLLGRLFTSEGESSQKRNLLIFVTANLISPGGSPSRQNLRTVEPNTLFQNPVLLTPGGSATRETQGK